MVQMQHLLKVHHQLEQVLIVFLLQVIQELLKMNRLTIMLEMEIILLTTILIIIMVITLTTIITIIIKLLVEIKMIIIMVTTEIPVVEIIKIIPLQEIMEKQILVALLTLTMQLKLYNLNNNIKFQLKIKCHGFQNPWHLLLYIKIKVLLLA